MKKYSVVAFVIALFASVFSDAGAANMAKVSYASGKFTFNITLEKADKFKIIHLELSVYDDFSRVRTVEVKAADPNAGENRSRSLSETALAEGDYYWRVRVSDTEARFTWIYPLESQAEPLHFTGETKAYQQQIDETQFEPAEFDDGTKLKLSSVWLRSHALGNHTYISVDHPIGADHKKHETFTHGFVVNDGTIYLCRGSFRAAGWDSDKSRVWLLRYDLATGEELPMLWVYAPAGGVFPLDQVMPWIRTDDDGTIYFSTFSYALGNNKVVLYTLDLDGVTVDTHSVTATEVASVSMNKGIAPYYITVSGSIKSGSFEMWGATENYSDGFGSHSPAEWQVVRWKIDGGSAVEELSDIMDLGFMVEDPEYYGYMMKVYPVGDDCFYLHGYSMMPFDALSPTLYRFNAGGSCELLDCYAPDGLYPVMRDPRIGGLAMPVLEGKQMLVYGVQSSRDAAASAAKIVHVPSLMSDFDTHRELWRLGDGKGFSSNLVQGLEVRYMPDESEHTGGILVAYLGNGALGVYRVDVTSPTVSIDDAVVAPVRISYDGMSVSADVELDGMSVYDMQGRCVASCRSVTDHVVTGNLLPGVYIVNDNLSQLNLKLIVY